MIKNIIRRNLRQPLAALAVVLFAAVLTVVICHLYQSGQEEQRTFKKTHASIPVFFKVVDLDGSKPKDYTGINGWVVDLFEDDWPTPQILPYVGETHIRISLSGEYYLINEFGNPLLDKWGNQESRPQTTTGISSTRVAEELTEGWGGKIYWYEGYDESILLGDEFVCIVPERMRNYLEMDLEFQYAFWPTGIVGDLGGPIMMESRNHFKVVGYYTDPGNNRIYCPYRTMEAIHSTLRKTKVIEEIGAILKDNTKLAQFKEDAAQWFAKPNPMGNKTPWGRYDFEYYLYALDIDDTMLINLETNMKNSLRLNRLVSAVIFLLSAGAGFLTGFLLIRSRKREITLMRTVGASQRTIFAELALEQMLCVVLGILLGGSYTLWQPIGNLVLFSIIYFAGLSTALIVFLRQNLLNTMKEDE